jgi:hypothetical protein
MFCSKCGTQLPDEANFCWKCGKPQKAGASAEKGQYETCEITFETLKEAGFFSRATTERFYAHAVHPTRGVYRAGESSPVKGEQLQYASSSFPDMGDLTTKRELDALVRKLLADGWNMEAAAPVGWKHTFRRPVR